MRSAARDLGYKLYAQRGRKPNGTKLAFPLGMHNQFKNIKLRSLVSLFAVAMSSPTHAMPQTDNSSSKQVSCEQSSGPVLANDSPNKGYFEDLLKRGASAPLKDFMKLWYPDRKASGEMDPIIKDCIANPSYCEPWRSGKTSFSFAELRAFPQVRLDTVYSWGSVDKLEGLQHLLPNGAVWSENEFSGFRISSLFSAVGSYGYGLVPIRIRLAQDKVLENMNISITSDYSISSSNEIESWSYGTPEHYDEIVRDYLRYKSGQPWVGYSASSGDDDKMQLFFEGLDGHDFGESNLKASLLEMIRMILAGEGRIYQISGLCRSRDLEFKTLYPTYINPFKAENR